MSDGKRPVKAVGRALGPAREVKAVGRAGAFVKEEKPLEGELAAEVKQMVAELDTGFSERRKQEEKRFWNNVDTEYWCCICFQNREQKETFLRALRLAALGDKYLDGEEVARVLGVTLPAGPVWPRVKLNKAFGDLT